MVNGIPAPDKKDENKVNRLKRKLSSIHAGMLRNFQCGVGDYRR
ncbi:MAG: hypothetical protein ABOK23_04035 [Candidatus Methanoperedens sp.]|nr:hypothetical protein [Candidatus Methanoperedens sp.]MCZ7394537.1 hypothetical protein [Candidatus Methanoperedens sp.]